MGGINHPDLEVCYWFYHITWYVYRNVLNLLNLYTGWWIQHFKTQDKQLDNHWLVTSEQYPISRLPYRTYLPGHCHGLETTHPRLRKVAAKLNKLDTIEQRTVNRPDADIWVPTLFCVYIYVCLYMCTLYIFIHSLYPYFSPLPSANPGVGGSINNLLPALWYQRYGTGWTQVHQGGIERKNWAKMLGRIGFLYRVYTYTHTIYGVYTYIYIMRKCIYSLDMWYH